MADLLYPDLWRVFDSNGDPAPGAQAWFYAAGTTTPKQVYSDEATTTPVTQPLVADGNGVFEQVFASGAYKVVVKDAAGAALYTLDPAVRVPASGAGASDVSFEPTPQVPETNVQAAIESVVQVAASGYNAFGLGISGNAVLLAGIDTTGTGTGAYRFDGTTTGTYPSGVVASDTGIVVMWREAAGSARQWIYPDNSDQSFMRRLISSTWGAWREEIHVPAGALEGDIIYRGASSWSRLAKGAAHAKLAMNAAGTLPEWNAGNDWADVSGSRSPNTDYTNSSGSDVEVSIYGVSNTSSVKVVTMTKGATTLTVGSMNASPAGRGVANFTWPNGWTMKLEINCTIDSWVERPV